MEIQQRISKYIDKHGIKKTYVAEKAGLTFSRFSFIINNRSELKADEFAKICDALDVSPLEFMSKKESEE